MLHSAQTGAVQSLLALLAYLRTNGFKTYIVSGGNVSARR
jgi:hypothetical protein